MRNAGIYGGRAPDGVDSRLLAEQCDTAMVNHYDRDSEPVTRADVDTEPVSAAPVPTDDVVVRAQPWMQQCGPHDYGIDGTGCACPPDGDPRPIVAALVREIERLRATQSTDRAAHPDSMPVVDEDGVPLTPAEALLYHHFRYLACPSPVDSVDTDDCADMAVEVIRFLTEKGVITGAARSQPESAGDDPWHSGEAIAAANAEHGEPF